MISSGINLVMTVIGFAMSTLFIVFVCTRLICARIQMSVSRRSFARASRSDLSILERGFHGPEPLKVANFPTKKYKELWLSSKESARCTICLADYHEEDTLRILPVCGHFFHATCIDMWLHRHSTCPVCRVSLLELPERKWFMQPMFSSALRSQYSMQAINAHYCRCMENIPSSRVHENEIMVPTHEVCRHSQGDGSVNIGDRNPISIDHQQIVKDSTNRKVESPSNQ